MPDLTFEDAAKFFDRGVAKLEAEIMRAEEENLREALDVARAFSQGTYSTEDLARMGHPYSRRRPGRRASAPDINTQTGDFLEGWRIIPPEMIGGDLVSGLENTDPKAEWLAMGTDRMVGRDYATAIEERIADRVQARREAAIRKAFE